MYIIKDGAPTLPSWYRVALQDGSTVAYTPDQVTARLIAGALEAHEDPGCAVSFAFPTQDDYATITFQYPKITTGGQ